MSVVLTESTPRRLAINALFIQPTSLCALTCPGCYVKDGYVKHSSAKYLSNTFLTTIIENVNRDINSEVFPSLYLNQITMAVDVINDKQEQAHKDRLITRLMTYRNNIVRRKYKFETSLPEFHATFFSLDQVFLYAHEIANDRPSCKEDRITWTVDYLKCIDLISISQLSKANALMLNTLTQEGLKINWNYQPQPGNVDNQVELVKAVLPAVNSMYFILHKPDLGKEIPKGIADQYFKVLNALKKELEPELFSKIQLDGCVKDAKKYVDTGFGCSSNVSRFQVWPGGEVTGCPYKHSPSTEGTSSYKGLIQNILTAKQNYEFKECKIPKALHPKHPKMLAIEDEAEFPYLRILQ